MPKRKLGRFPNYGGPGHSQKPGTHGRAQRGAKKTQRTMPAQNKQKKMPAAPVGKAITKANQDHLPRR
jgi:hypothetical protein